MYFCVLNVYEMAPFIGLVDIVYVDSHQPLDCNYDIVQNGTFTYNCRYLVSCNQLPSVVHYYLSGGTMKVTSHRRYGPIVT